ncbi:MAG: Trm112 family protein [Armatimonadetes bacterium]|nr:Trm112 family protein [Armatimonadota bacterium]
MIDEYLLEVLACPRCDSRPSVELKEGFLVCTECNFGYRIEDGIPNMLAEEAVPPEEWRTEQEKGDA